LEIVDKTVTQAQKEWKKDEGITSSGNLLDSYSRKVQIEFSADGGLPCDLWNFLFFRFSICILKIEGGHGGGFVGGRREREMGVAIA
jgi:hypothetical protein